MASSSSIDVRRLRYFVAVAQAQSFRGAARALDLHLPSLSRGVRRLEDELGVSLFERHREGVRLTGAGRAFLRDVHRVLFELDRAVAGAGLAGRAEVGQLNLGFFTSLISGRLHDLLASYRRAWPKVAVRVHEGPYLEQFAALHERRLDVAIYAGDERSPLVDTLDLWSERLFVAVPEGHRLASDSSTDWQQLGEELLLVRSWESEPVVCSFLVTRFAARGHRPRIVQHAASRENLLGLVRAGFGVTIVAEPATAARYPGVVFRPIAEADAFLPIRAAWLPQNDNPVLRRFLAILRQHAESTASPARRHSA